MCEEVHQPPHSLLRAAEETPVSRANIPYPPQSTYLNILIIVCHNQPQPCPGIATCRQNKPQ